MNADRGAQGSTESNQQQSCPTKVINVSVCIDDVGLSVGVYRGILSRIRHRMEKHRLVFLEV